MTGTAKFSSEERVGIAAAILVHAALAAALAWHATREPVLPEPAERIDVSLATEVSLQSTAPDPSAQPAMALAPELGEPAEAPPVVVDPAPVPEPEVRPTARPRPPLPFPTPPRNARSEPRPEPRPEPRRTQAPSPAPAPTSRATTAPRASNLGDNFLEGRSDARGASGSPAATFGAAERASLASAITRQLRRHWTAPNGLEAEQLVSVVAWRLNRDGSLSGRPRCVTQRGITDSNRPQADLHCERAIRAVTLAAPFDLPEQFYSRWDDLEWDFDRRL